MESLQNKLDTADWCYLKMCSSSEIITINDFMKVRIVLNNIVPAVFKKS